MTSEIRPVPSHLEAPTSAETGTPTARTPSQSRSRRNLTYQASCWRFLEQIGAYLHNWPDPKPPAPSFIRQFTTTNVGSLEAASIELSFYVPTDYSQQAQHDKRYPVVVNFHGGGFTLGTAKDDSRWAGFIIEEVKAVFVSVDYRLAPEFPFPTAVEDGVEALLHLAANANEYRIDPKLMALTGFSAGGNLAFTVPLRLQTHLQSIRNELASKALDPAPSELTLPEIVCIISWYPIVDQRISRADRRASCSRPDKTLPPILTDLFDEAYLPEVEMKSSPYASPAVASDEMLRTALPDNIAIFLCEWDMLIKEGNDLCEKLTGLGKNVQCTLIREKRHAFDKSPYPFSVDPKVTLHYREACSIARKAFGMTE